jgi:8-oxo-dGTP diphosphatase
MKCRRARSGELVHAARTAATFVVERDRLVIGACAYSSSPEPSAEFSDAALGDAGVVSLLVDRCESQARRDNASAIFLELSTFDFDRRRELEMRGYFPSRESHGRVVLRRQLAGLDGEGIVYRHFDEVPWHNWAGTHPATLLFIVLGGRILLIEKKRGHGAGLVNGPGGKLETGETPVQCAVREVEEETGVHPLGARLVGELHFQYSNGDTVYGYAFRADAYSGTLIETAEANPFWVRIDDIPYDDMWDDDRVWLPLLLQNRPFIGRFLVHEGRLFQHEIVPRGRRR